MLPSRRASLGPLILLAALGLAALYLEPLRTGFLNDDHLFLEQARSTRLVDSLRGLGPLGNYFRPLSRQLYFELLSPLGQAHPLVFHLANFAIFLAALALLADLLRVLLPPAGAAIGCLYVAMLPFQRVNLTWVSCSQDLLAITGALGAIALFRRGRRPAALLCYLAAIASKESALPLPGALFAWEVLIERRPPRAAARSVAPFALCGLVWIGIAIAIRRGQEPRPLFFDAEHFLAGYVHLVQSLLGLEHPSGMLASLLRHPPPLVPLIVFAALVFLLATSRAETEPKPNPARGAIAPRPRPDVGTVAKFALVWLALFGIATGPVAATWSAYYYTLAAVGAALLIGLALRPAGSWSWIALVAGLLWWHAGSSNTRAFAVADGPWNWTSHLTSFYFQRGAAATDTLSRQLRALEPAPPRNARFFFATLPSWAGFQMGNGALVRNLYRDPTLGSHFYSEFSESTAADRPCRFFYWNGAALEPLYAGNRDPFFQVGSDLLLLDRYAGAEHAFHRGLAEGGDRKDLLYWLGWTELWLGRRSAAEDVWGAFGARDDSAKWIAHLRDARTALIDDRDTLDARRQLLQAIENGMGRPEAHAVLGQLLMRTRPKYALLELKAATWLNPSDWMARRDLYVGLAGVRLDEAARKEFRALVALYPEWSSDSALVRAHRAVESRSTEGRRVAEFE